MEPQFKIHQYTELYSQKPIHFQITEMNKSIMIWVGRPQDGLSDLSVAMPSINKVSSVCVRVSVLRGIWCLRNTSDELEHASTSIQFDHSRHVGRQCGSQPTFR
jgi:hypothetical protein